MYIKPQYYEHISGTCNISHANLYAPARSSDDHCPPIPSKQDLEAKELINTATQALLLSQLVLIFPELTTVRLEKFLSETTFLKEARGAEIMHGRGRDGESQPLRGKLDWITRH